VQYLSNAPTAANTQDWGEENLQELPGVRVEQVSDNVQLRLITTLGNEPYFYMERTFYSALSTGGYLTAANRRTGDAASTLCPTDYAVPAMVHLLASQYLIRNPEEVDFWSSVMARANHMLRVRERQYGPTPRPRIERAREIRIPQLRV
jgi:hypothetical protein